MVASYKNDIRDVGSIADLVLVLLVHLVHFRLFGLGLIGTSGTLVPGTLFLLAMALHPYVHHFHLLFPLPFHLLITPTILSLTAPFKTQTIDCFFPNSSRRRDWNFLLGEMLLLGKMQCYSYFELAADSAEGKETFLLLLTDSHQHQHHKTHIKFRFTSTSTP